MQNALPALLTAALFLSANAAHAEVWQIYHEASFQCHLEYPSTIFMKGSIDDDQFQTFANANGDITLRIASRPNEAQWTPEEIKAEFLTNSGDRLVYERLKDDYVVLSGFKDEDIFYSKIALSEDRKNLCIMHIYYPPADKQALDDIVKRMSQSFRAPGHRISLLQDKD